jgi:hypothetical protein
MKILIIAISMLACSLANLQAQTYPLASARDFKVLVSETDYVKMKLLIFDDNDVHAERFLYFALLQGLASDGLSGEIALSVASETEGPNFVPKCNICAATRKAFSDYNKYGKAFDKGNNTYPNLTVKNAELRHLEITALTDNYTTALLTQLKLTDAEAEKLQAELLVMRKQGMVGLSDDFGSKGCPSCDGATHQKKQ